MQVDMSLAEILMNAVTHGRVHGFQLKRGFGMKPDDERRCFDDLSGIIERWQEKRRGKAASSSET